MHLCFIDSCEFVKLSSIFATKLVTLGLSQLQRWPEAVISDRVSGKPQSLPLGAQDGHTGLLDVNNKTVQDLLLTIPLCPPPFKGT